MTPSSKSKELFYTFYELTPLDASINDTVEEASHKIMRDRHIAKLCALACVDEIMKSNAIFNDIKLEDGRVCTSDFFWREVKAEIRKIE